MFFLRTFLPGVFLHTERFVNLLFWTEPSRTAWRCLTTIFTQNDNTISFIVDYPITLILKGQSLPQPFLSCFPQTRSAAFQRLHHLISYGCLRITADVGRCSEAAVSWEVMPPWTWSRFSEVTAAPEQEDSQLQSEQRDEELPGKAAGFLTLLFKYLLI